MNDFLILIGVLAAITVPVTITLAQMTLSYASKRASEPGFLDSSKNPCNFAIFKITPMNHSTIYRVRFKQAIDGQKEHFFFSLAAIYDHFTEEQVGAPLRKLWESGVSNGNSFKTDQCTIQQERVYRKPQARKRQ
jgi:hypothetical protein